MKPVVKFKPRIELLREYCKLTGYAGQNGIEPIDIGPTEVAKICYEVFDWELTSDQIVDLHKQL